MVLANRLTDLFMATGFSFWMAVTAAGADPGAGWVPPAVTHTQPGQLPSTQPGAGFQPPAPTTLSAPKSVPMSSQQPHWALLARARALLLSGKVQQALPLFQQFVAMRPLEPDGLFWLGLALDESDLPEQAAEAYRKAIAQASRVGLDSCELHNNLGNALLKLGRNDEAVSEYRRAEELEPQATAPRLNHARALLVSKQAQQALDILTKYDAPDAPKAQLHYYRAKALKMLDKPEAARAEASKALESVLDDATRAAIAAEFEFESGTP